MSNIIIPAKNIYKVDNNKVVDNKINNIQTNEQNIEISNTTNPINVVLYAKHNENLTIDLIKERNKSFDIYKIFTSDINFNGYLFSGKYVKLGTKIEINNYILENINAIYAETYLGYINTDNQYVEDIRTISYLNANIEYINYDDFLQLNSHSQLKACYVYIIQDKCTDNSIYFGFDMLAYHKDLSEGWNNKIECILTINLYTKNSEKISFGNGNKTLKLQSSNLVTNNTKYNGNKISNVLANSILDKYANGKELATIDINIDEYYDKDNVLAISTKDDSLPMLFKNGDIVIPYVRTSKIVNDNIEYGEEPLSGTIANPKEFIVIGTETFNKGYCGQRLTIREK